MRHSRPITSVVKISDSDGYLSPASFENETSLQALLSSSPGALLLDESETPYVDAFRLLDKELEIRLSFEWVLPERPLVRPVALIGGRTMFDPAKMSFCYKGPYEAALALGISVIVVDNPGHWLEDDSYSHLRARFIAIDMTLDEELPGRITEALRGTNLHGVASFADEYLEATARAAETLGLPTEPVSAVYRSVDKYAARKLVTPGKPTDFARLNNAAQLNDLALLPFLNTLQYSVIVKPCRGGGSKGVRKANNRSDLYEAVNLAEQAGYFKDGILIEAYADGPEVDANFALWDGEILFFEMCDDFPCLADSANATVADDFNEDVMVLPSALDLTERQKVKIQLHEILLRLGFRTGIFHVEARMQNSSMRYMEREGVVDLQHIDQVLGPTRSRPKPKVFLIEINPRPPGPDCIYATAYTYGVDYCGLHWLRALNDGRRLAALCHPFTIHAQYHTSLLSIPIYQENLYVPRDYCEEMLRRLPDIAPYISKTECFTPGKTVSPKGGAGFFAYFLIYSRSGRKQLLEMSDRIREESKGLLDNA